MRTITFIFMVIITVGGFSFPTAFGQADDPLEAFLNEEETDMENQTPEERFQNYLDSIILERQAFQKALSGMLQFLSNIEDNKVRRSDVDKMKQQLMGASDLLSENEMALSFKEDGIFESLEQCMETAPSQTTSSP